MTGKHEQIEKAWAKFVETGEPEPKIVRQVIIESWERCRRMGLDPSENYAVSKPLFRDGESLIKENQKLLEVATPHIALAYSLIKQSGFLISLCDANGYIISIEGDSEVLEMGKNSHIVVGANRSEHAIGTGAVGLALKDKQPIQIVGPEHYNRNFHYWTCSAAPIFNEQRQMIGALYISGKWFLSHSHTLGIASSLAENVTKEICLRESNQEQLELNEYLKAVIESSSQGVLVIDRLHRLVAFNRNAVKILGNEICSQKGQNIHKFLLSSPQLLELAEGKPFRNREFVLRTTTIEARCLIDVQPITDEKASMVGWVVFLNEAKMLNNLAQKIAGGRAFFTFDSIIGNNLELRRVINIAEAVAGADTKVLLQGESGTGKELFAQSIHNSSHRRNGPFVAINCSAIPRELLESELFGYEYGAFTGAQKGGKPGKFELANSGTVFLDEIGDMPLEMQSKLLRVLQDNYIGRVGGIEAIPIDIRVVAATNKDLFREVEEGNFREDLYYRLSVVTMKIPPLRDRKEDIPFLIKHFLHKISGQLRVATNEIDQEAMELLMNYSWPGNIRELENVIERAIVLSKGEKIGVNLIPDKICGTRREVSTNGPINDQQKLGVVQRQTILQALTTNKGNISKTAKTLGIARNTLYKKIKDYNLTNLIG